MGGCVASKLGGEEEVVVMCRERKRLMKLTVDTRYALAEAHCTYSHSLYAVSAAIKLFVARHSTPSSPFLITFPPPNCSLPPPSSSLPLLLHSQNPKTQLQQQQDVEETSGYLFMGEQRDLGWDFFNPFFAEDHFRAVREQEGIPDLEQEEEEEEEEEKEEEELEAQVAVAADVGEKGVTRELLDALKDIEDHFCRAYDSTKHVSKMLEANKVHLTSGLEEIKENSTKLIQAITWHRPSSCKSLVSSTSNNSSSWTQYKNELFDGKAGMAAGSHSLTLGRLYAWEKKLYDEVKAGDNIRKLYERKCSQLRNKNVKGEDTLSLDKSRAGAGELYSRILVAIRRAESISEKIQKLTTEELQPQIIELLQGLAQSWRMMLEFHETQRMIISQVKFYECPSYGKFCSDSHRLATLQLEAEIQNWKECFDEYVAAQKSYVEALSGWLSKFIVPEVEFCTRGRSSVPPFRSSGPPLYTICHDWLSSMDSLPDKTVSVAMRSFVKDLRALWAQQGEEQEQKRKVEKLAKELDKKILSYQKAAESRMHEPKLLEYNKDADVNKEDSSQLHHQVDDDNLMEKKETLESLKRRLDKERERHNKCMLETQRITLDGFQTGFSSIFDSLVRFGNTSLNMYNNLGILSQSLSDPSSLQNSNAEQDNGS